MRSSGAITRYKVTGADGEGVHNCHMLVFVNVCAACEATY